MELLLKTLLIAVFVAGHVFGYMLFYKENSKRNQGLFISAFATIYPLILFFTFIAWILSTRYTSIRFFFLIGLNFTYIVSSLLSALASNIILQKIENKINSSEIGITYILRLVILGYGAFCIASSISVTKSTLYLIEVTNYSFGSEIKSIIKTNSREKINRTNEDIRNISYFLNDVKQINNDTLKIIWKNFFSFVTRNSLVDMGGNYNFQLEYEYTPASKNAPMSVHNVIYKSLQNNYEFSVCLSTIGGRMYFIVTKELIQAINRQLSEFNSIKLQIETKPAGLLEFAFSSLMELLEVKNYDFIPIDERSKLIDFILKWLFWIITSIIFFEFIRNWRKMENS